MKKMKYILSPCGTSLLTNGVSTEERQLVFKNANKKTAADLPENERQKLQELMNHKAVLLDKASNQDVAKMSAELNSILKIYNGNIINCQGDYHLLLSTDTWLGEETAKLAQKWLKKHAGLTVEIHRQPDLQTESLPSFQLALSDLVKKLSEETENYKQGNYHIIFNLTGGFKSVQGFLQSIANFYADETVYIFESASELLRIPRLPVKMDTTSTIKDHITVFRQLSLGMNVSQEKLKDIAETLLLTIDDETSLSPWGEVIWEQAKKEIYQTKLLPEPSVKIKYENSFKKSINKLTGDKIKILNDRIDQLARYLQNTDQNNLASLDFKRLQSNHLAPSTHEMDAWSGQDAKRIFGHYNNNMFILDKLDKGLH